MAFHEDIRHRVLGLLLRRQNHLSDHLNRLLDLKSQDIGLPTLSKEVDFLYFIVVVAFIFDVLLDFFRLGEIDWSPHLNLIYHLVLCG
jgi:hypothetical protein